MPLRQMLRSLPDYSYFVTILLVNVPGWLSRHHPGDPNFWHKIAATRYIRLISYGYRVRARGNITVKRALSPHPCGLPRPTGNDSAIYSRTHTLAVMSMYHRQRFIAEVIRRYAALGKMADTITPRTPSRHPYAAV